MSGGRSHLQHALDREVYQLVQASDDRSLSGVYSKIRASNTALSRRPKKQLEDSIERALDHIAAESEMEAKSVTEIKTSSVKRKINGELPPSKRKANNITHAPPTHVSLEDLGGVGHVVRQLTELIVLPLRWPKLYLRSRVRPTRGILLHGPPGCGKTMIANAFAARIGVPFFNISAPSIVSGMSGESEKALREYFEEAKRLAPCIVFIDEIDAVCPKRENAQREMEKRIVAQLLTCMDDLDLEKTGGKGVVVMAATNRPDSLDPALRRAGRFDKEINLGVPSQQVREQILRKLTRQMDIKQDFDYGRLAMMTPGYVGADLSDLVSTASSIAIQRLVHSLQANATSIEIDGQRTTDDEELHQLDRLLKITAKPEEIETQYALDIDFDDFLHALPKIQPSAKREGFTTVPDTTWQDVGSLDSVRQALEEAVVQPIVQPEVYEGMGVDAPAGILLWGPPGCGKTLLAKAVANESQANFISVKGPELLNKYVGESERAVRQIFMRARSSIPCIIFFDELDALVPARKDALSESASRVVNTLLTELDGLESRKGIYVIGATNRPDAIDTAMLRGGRFETHLLVNLPDSSGRVDVVKTLARKYPIDPSIDLANLAERCYNFSGADFTSLLRQAANVAIKRKSRIISLQDLSEAQARVGPSVDVEKYRRLKKHWGASINMAT